MATVQQLDAPRAVWSPTQEKVDLAIKKAIEIAEPSRVFLFGSWPRGEATSDSDLDLAVFVSDDRKNEIGELHKKIRDGLRGIQMSIDLIIASEGHFAESLDSVNSVYYKIVHRGKLVYDCKDR
jgi:predicted nucleotidyltransferase